jgi:hypothetical protein
MPCAIDHPFPCAIRVDHERRRVCHIIALFDTPFQGQIGPFHMQDVMSPIRLKFSASR